MQSWQNFDLKAFTMNDSLSAVDIGSKDNSMNIFLAELCDNVDTYHEVNLTQPCILVIGSEAAGISEEARFALPKARSIHVPLL